MEIKFDVSTTSSRVDLFKTVEMTIIYLHTMVALGLWMALSWAS